MGSAHSQETIANTYNTGIETVTDLVSDFASYQYQYQDDNNMNWNSAELEREPMSYDAENGNLDYFPSQDPWTHVEHKSPKEAVKTYFVPADPEMQEREQKLIPPRLQDESAKRLSLQDKLDTMTISMENIRQENATLKSRLRILNELIFDEQEKAIEEENKREAAEEKCRILEEKLRQAEEELSASRSLLTKQASEDSDSVAHSDNEMDCSSDNEAPLTVRCILEHAADINIEYAIQALNSQVGDANRVEIGDTDMKPETSHSRIPSNDSGIEFDFDLQTSEADAEVDNNTNSEDRQSECSSVTSPPLLHLEEENRQLQYYLECTNNELVSTRQQMSDLDARLLEVEEDRARLIKRVTGLFRSKKAAEEEYHSLRDLMRRVKNHLIEVQANACEMEEGYMDMIQKMAEDKEKMIERGKKRLNKFRSGREVV